MIIKKLISKDYENDFFDLSIDIRGMYGSS